MELRRRRIGESISSSDFLLLGPLVFLFGSLLFLGSWVGSVHGEIRSNQHVVDLNTTNFFDQIEHGQWIIKFYEDWCGICQRVARPWTDAATDIAKRGFGSVPIRFGRVRCETSPQICLYYGVQGYPTFKYFHRGLERPWDHEPTYENFMAFSLEITKASPIEIENEAEWDAKWNERQRALKRKLKQRMAFFFFGLSISPERIAYDMALRDFTDVADFYATESPELAEKFLGHSRPGIVAISDHVVKPYLRKVIQDYSDMNKIRAWIRENRYYYAEYFGTTEREHELPVSEKRVVLIVTPGEIPETNAMLEKYASEHTQFRFIRIDAINLGTINWLNRMQLNRKSVPQLIYWDVVDNLKYYSGVPEGNQLTPKFIDQFLQRVKEDKIEPIGNPPSIETRIEEMIYFFARHCYPFAWFLGLCMQYPVGVVVFFGMVSFVVVVLTVAFICLDRKEERAHEERMKKLREQQLQQQGQGEASSTSAPAKKGSKKTNKTTKAD